MEKSSTYNQKKPRKLLDQVRDVMRLKHYAFSTERTYTSWIKRFILFHDKKHPKDMGEPEVEAFLTWLAVEKSVSKSTQNQAFNALIFLYREVLNRPLEGRINAVRSSKKQRLPIVMSKEVYGVKSTLDSYSIVPRVKSRLDPLLHSKPPHYLQHTIAELSYGPIRK